MDNWTDNLIRQHVEELIKESYLLSLSEDELQLHLRGFIKACESVIRENVSLRGDIRVTKIKVALLRAYLLLSGNRDHVPVSPDVDRRSSSGHMARQVLNIKQSVLTLLGAISPRLVTEVVDRTKPDTPEQVTDEDATDTLPARWFPALLPALGFYGLAAVVLLMVALTVFG